MAVLTHPQDSPRAFNLIVRVNEGVMTPLSTLAGARAVLHCATCWRLITSVLLSSIRTAFVAIAVPAARAPHRNNESGTPQSLSTVSIYSVSDGYRCCARYNRAPFALIA